MGWELVVASAILGTALITAAKTWAKEKADARDEREANARHARESATKCPHVWGKWEIKREGSITHGNDEDHVVGFFSAQRRFCEMCGEMQSTMKRVNLPHGY